MIVINAFEADGDAMLKRSAWNLLLDPDCFANGMNRHRLYRKFQLDLQIASEKKKVVDRQISCRCEKTLSQLNVHSSLTHVACNRLNWADVLGGGGTPFESDYYGQLHWNPCVLSSFSS